MSSYVDTYAVVIIAAILVIFTGIFIVLIFYATIHRYILNRRARIDQEADVRIQPLIYSYLDNQIKRKDFSEILCNTYDLAAAYRIISIMIDNLEGEEREKLQDLLELSKFNRYFLRKLRSRRPMHIAQACIYFSHRAVTDKGSVPRLIRLQRHTYNVIAYASTLALVNSVNRQLRDDALLRFLHRSHNASMAVNDIIFKYYGKYQDKEEASEKLVFYVMDPAMPDKTRAAVIAMFPGFGFYQWIETLHELLMSVAKVDPSGILTATLIQVLHELSDENLQQIIQKYRLWNSPFQHVRLQVARVFAADPAEPQPVEVLLELAHDPDLEVRIVAQIALLKTGKSNLPDNAFAPEILPEWNEMKQTGEACVRSF